MAATLNPVYCPCPCGKLIGYEIRAGVAHHDPTRYDPYEVGGFLRKEAGGWIIGPLAGELYLGFVKDLRKALGARKIQKVRWERAKKHGLKDVTEIVTKAANYEETLC